jgi:hypothetical protein
LDPCEFKCKRIDKKDLWSIADDIRNKYLQEGTLPINIEKIIEFRLNLLIKIKPFPITFNLLILIF